MRKIWHRSAAVVAAAAMLCTQSLSVSAQPGEAYADAAVSVEYLTIQPGATTASVNLNWYAPDGTETAMVRFGDITAQASVSELTAPTKLDTGKYTDTGKMVCKAVIEGLAPDTAYTYQISYDGGQTWSQEYTYTTPGADEFSFAFTSDPQIKEDQSHDDRGWNSADGLP